MVTGDIVRLSSTVEGGDGVSGGKALSPTMTADGDIVVFDSFSRLTPDDTGNDRDIYWTNTLLKANAFAVKAQQFFAAARRGSGVSATIAGRWADEHGHAGGRLGFLYATPTRAAGSRKPPSR